MRILNIALIVCTLTACSIPNLPSSGTGTPAEPYTETSFDYNAKPTKPARTSVLQNKPRSNSVHIGDYDFSVVETSGGFAVLKLDPVSLTVLERADYENTDFTIVSLANPRLGSVSGTSFTVTLMALRESGSTTETFAVSTSPLRVTKK